MAWLSSATAYYETDKTEYVERLCFWPSGYVIKRTVTRTTTVFVGMTSAAADTQLTTSAGTAGCVSARKDRENDAGAYRVTQEIETYGAWAYEETFAEVGP